jgi:hypothetical protein
LAIDTERIMEDIPKDGCAFCHSVQNTFCEATLRILSDVKSIQFSATLNDRFANSASRAA